MVGELLISCRFILFPRLFDIFHWDNQQSLINIDELQLSFHMFHNHNDFLIRNELLLINKTYILYPSQDERMSCKFTRKSQIYNLCIHHNSKPKSQHNSYISPNVDVVVPISEYRTVPFHQIGPNDHMGNPIPELLPSWVIGQQDQGGRKPTIFFGQAYVILEALRNLFQN